MTSASAGDQMSSADAFYMETYGDPAYPVLTICLLPYYNRVFDSCWKKKSLYPLCLLGYSDFCRRFEL